MKVYLDTPHWGSAALEANWQVVGAARVDLPEKADADVEKAEDEAEEAEDDAEEEVAEASLVNWCSVFAQRC